MKFMKVAMLMSAVVLCVSHSTASATDIDGNGIVDAIEQEIVELYSPSLVLHSEDLADGGLPVCPEPVEIMTNRFYTEIWSRAADFAGHRYMPWNVYFPNGNYSTMTYLGYAENLIGSCGVGYQQEDVYAHFDFGGYGPGCTTPESGGNYDQPAGWRAIYKNGVKEGETWVTEPGSHFPHTMYAHIYHHGYHPVTSDPVWVIQYWFFFPYDDWVNVNRTGFSGGSVS